VRHTYLQSHSVTVVTLAYPASELLNGATLLEIKPGRRTVKFQRVQLKEYYRRGLVLLEHNIRTAGETASCIQAIARFI
jgi:hypothetical protein